MTGGQPAEDDLCPPGYYCPTGTKFAEEFACPNGTFNPDYGQNEEADCQECTQGMGIVVGVLNEGREG